MHDVLLQCRLDTQNLKGKLVTILKLLIRAIHCRQAETPSFYRLGSTSKSLRMMILRNCKQIVWKDCTSKWHYTLYQGMPLQIQAVSKL